MAAATTFREFDAETIAPCCKVNFHMNYPLRSIDYLERADAQRKLTSVANLRYAALELRCGIEARLKEYASHAVGITKSQAREWEITKLGKTLDTAFGTGDTIFIIIIDLESGLSGQFIYAPVTSRLQEIGKRLGFYLHAQSADTYNEEEYLTHLKSLLHEGCGLLRLACSGEVLRPTIQHGLQLVLDADDPRIKIVEAIQAGERKRIQILNIDPVGAMTFYDR